MIKSSWKPILLVLLILLSLGLDSGCTKVQPVETIVQREKVECMAGPKPPFPETIKLTEVCPLGSVCFPEEDFRQLVLWLELVEAWLTEVEMCVSYAESDAV